jgi:hypothetical protein
MWLSAWQEEEEEEEEEEVNCLRVPLYIHGILWISATPLHYVPLRSNWTYDPSAAVTAQAVVLSHLNTDSVPLRPEPLMSLFRLVAVGFTFLRTVKSLCILLQNVSMWTVMFISVNISCCCSQWHESPCGTHDSVRVYSQHVFRGSLALRNVGILPHRYTVSQPWRPRFESSSPCKPHTRIIISC